MQSNLLAGAVGASLVVKAVAVAAALMHRGPLPRWFWIALAVSAAFALLVRLLRSATTPAAAVGALVCLNLLLGQGHGASWPRTGMPSLIALFVLTFAATRFGRHRKEQLGTAEPRHGRRASQVAANLGIAGLCGGAASPLQLAACLAALAEATADTISSELGQVLGGRPVLITTGRAVSPGTDGAISPAGTTLGATAAALTLLATTSVPWRVGASIFIAALAGLFVDSLLGATVERRGWLGNDLVNFTSTLFAAAAAAALTWTFT